MKYLLSLIALSLIAFVGCTPAVNKLAFSTLYPFAAVNKRLDERDSKEPPKDISYVSDLSQGHMWLSHRMDGDITVIYYHGNGESVVDLYDSNFLSRYLSMPGYNWGVSDYPGVGIGGTGKPSESSLVAMSSEALLKLIAAAKEDSKVFVWGRSLGAAVAAQVADKYQDRIDGLILVSPWTSFRDAARNNSMGKLIDDKFYVEHGYKTSEVCKNFTKPVLIVHGTEDKLIPYDHGKSLRSCFSNATLHTLEGMGHNDVYSTSEAVSAVRAFINAN